ncbi:MAG TPA: glycosyltransferase family 4 protein, partial [Cytophagales bacterium]|nr:glycosyltransferase family 4 protein [Cytophagales bacterium]
CHVSESYNTSFIGRLWAYFSFVFSSIWAGLFKVKGHYDLILVTSPPLFVGITALLLSKLKNLPLVFEIRDLWPESAIDTGVLTNKWIIKFAYWFEKTIYKNATLINTLTPAFQKKLIENKHIPAAKVIMIPNASDFSLSEHLLNTIDIVQVRAELGWSNKLVITYVGAHGVANHLVQILDAAAQLQDTKAHFVLIGAGMQREELIKDAQQRGLQNVEFIPPVSKQEVFKYILASDIGTSVLKKVDTFKTVYSNKTFDYMSCKKPIIMVIDGVSRALVEAAQCGVYAEPENASDIAAKVRYYLEQPQRITIEGENGYRYALAHFDRQVLGEKYLEYLQQLPRKSV